MWMYNFLVFKKRHKLFSFLVFILSYTVVIIKSLELSCLLIVFKKFLLKYDLYRMTV